MTQKNNNNYFDLNKNKKTIRRKSWLRIYKNFLLKGPEKWRNRLAGRIWDYVVDFFQLIFHYDLFSRSASIVYYLLLSFFPILILMMYLITLLSKNIDISPATIVAAQSLFPEPILDIIQSLTRSIKAPLSVFSLTASSITILWASSRGVAQIFRSIATIYPREKKGINVPTRIMGIVITIAIFILFGLATIIMSFGKALLNFLKDFLSFLDFNIFTFDLITFSFGIILIFIILFVLFFISSSRSAEKIPVIPGVIIASIAWVSLSYLYSFYISSKANFSNLYGGLANIIILMLWLNFSVQIILYGAIINYQVAWYKVQNKDNYLILNEIIKEIDENENPFNYLAEENLKSSKNNNSENITSENITMED